MKQSKITISLPNALTLSRLGLAAIMIVCLTLSFPYSKSAALIIFLIAGITDYLDGYLARNIYGVTPFGQLMDPLADKVMVCAAFICFVELGLLPAWLVIIIVSREFVVTGLRLLATQRGRVIAAGSWGKHKTVWQIVSIVALLLALAIRHDIYRHASAEFLKKFDFALGHIAFAIGVAVVMITVASGAIYFGQHRDLISQHIGRGGGRLDL